MVWQVLSLPGSWRSLFMPRRSAFSVRFYGCSFDFAGGGSSMCILVQERASGDLEPGEEDMSFLGRCSLSDFAVMTAYFASRGLQHTDTGIYHAQAIRWYEEYGLVKGLAICSILLITVHIFAYAAAFSMKWLVGLVVAWNQWLCRHFCGIWALGTV